MSKSYHTTRKDLKGKSKKEIDAMVFDPDSIFHELAEKRMVKESVIKKRKAKKQINEINQKEI